MHYAAVASKYIWANFIVFGAQKSMCLMSVETSLSKVDTGNHISAAHETPCDLIQVFGKDKDLSLTSNKFRDQGIGKAGGKWPYQTETTTAMFTLPRKVL